MIKEINSEYAKDHWLIQNKDIKKNVKVKKLSSTSFSNTKG